MLYFIEYFLWIVAVAAIYIAYKFKRSKHKDKFFKSSLALSIIGTIGMLSIAIIVVNTFFTNPPLKYTIEKSSSETNDKTLEKEFELEKALETNFLNVDLHYKYVTNHFTLPARWKKDGKYIYRNDTKLIDYYWDRTQFTEKEYSDIGHFGLGLMYMHLNRKKEALENYKKVNNTSMPYLNYQLGVVYLTLKDRKNAQKYFEAETKVKDGLTDKAYASWVGVLEKNKDEKKLTQLLNNPSTKKYIPSKLAVKLYFKDFNIPGYYRTLLKLTFYDLTLTAILAASLILLVWLLYINRIDLYEKERILPILITLVLGMLFSLGSMQLTHFNEFYLGYAKNGNKFHDLLFTIFGIGAVEELVKILPFLLMLTFTKYINEAFDYILYASVSALGFAFVENIIYFEGSSTIIHGRALTAVVGHMFNSSLIAYGLVLSKYRYKGSSALGFFGIFFLLGSVSHGIYDFLLFNHIIPLFILFFLFTITIWIVLINNSLNNSSYFSYRKKVNSERLQLHMALALTAILVFEYVAVALDKGPAIANDSLMNSVFTGSFLIIFFTSKLSRFDHVKNYWISLKYRGSETFNISRIIGWMIAGDIKPHNFVGQEIELKIIRESTAEFLKATIVDRMVVICLDENTLKEYKDPYWFLLNLHVPFEMANADCNHIAIKFHDERPALNEGEMLGVNLFGLPSLAILENEKIKYSDFISLGSAGINRQFS